MEFEFNIEKFNEPIIKKKDFSATKHKIFKKYSSELYQKYSFELLETLCNKSHFVHKTKILYSSIYFLLKFLYKSKNEIYIENYDLVILTSFYLGIKTVENQNKIPNLKKFKNIYAQKFGDYLNKEIRESELIYLKILDYNICFMTVYDYLLYIFHNKDDLILLHRKNIDKIITKNTIYFCTHSALELIQEVTNNPEINKVMKYPTIIQKKIIFKSRENSFGCEFGNNIDESLSTSISSGHQNNPNILFGEQNNTINFKKLENENTFINYTSRNYKPCYTKSNTKKCNLHFMNSSSYINFGNNLTINNSDSLDNEKMGNMFIYSKKNIKDLKSMTSKKEVNALKSENILKTDKQQKIFRNNKSSFYIYFRNSDNKNLSYTNSKNVYVKPSIKKEEGQNYFTSNKKREIKSKYISFKKMNNINEEDDCNYKEKLKKKLLFEESDNLE